MSENGKWSANFDSENVEPFLTRVSRFIESGFGDAEVARATTFINSTEHNDERQETFPIRYSGSSAELVIRVFMDDIDAPDLYISAPVELCNQIRREMQVFADELGL